MLTYAIDFGTSNSILGAAGASGMKGFAPLDPQSSDPAILRSLLYFPNGKEVFFGTKAIEEFTARDQMGRFIRSIKKQLPSRQFVGTFVDNRPMNLENLIGIFLGELRKRANAHFDEDVTRVVLGRPARFAPDEADDRYAEGRLEQAARIAGFKEIEFLPEPVAASVGYHIENNQSDEKIILTCDYGGGTSDYTVYKLSQKPFSPNDVIAMGGVSIAGDALDASLMRSRISNHFGTGVEYKVPFGSNILTMPLNLMERICHPAEISLLRKQDTFEFLKNVKQWSLGPDDQEKMNRLFILLEDQLGFSLFEKIESTKKSLSFDETSTFEFNYPGIKIAENIKRAEFETYALHAFEKINASLEDTLLSAQIKLSDISRVLCTGGTAKVPWIRESLKKRFGLDKIFDLDPFRGVAQGLMERAFDISKNS